MPRSGSVPPMSWDGKKVVVLGLARQGKALARFFSKQGARVVISDLKSESELAEELRMLADLGLEYILGDHPSELLDDAELLCLSGGVPADLALALEARQRGLPVTNDAQLFLERCPVPVIGITGSAGKTTTTVLVGRMALAQAGSQGGEVWVGGNIENPLLNDLERIEEGDRVVMELSSFQLELMKNSPQVAAILNITPNHLDRHGSMQAYAEAKAHILAFQSPSDIAVLGRDDPIAWEMRSRTRGRLLSFGWQDQPELEGSYVEQGAIWLRHLGRARRVFPLDRIELRGDHNILNAAAACAIAAAAGMSDRSMQEGLAGFRGVPHRLEFVRRLRGVEWINDSIATAPERSIAAMLAFQAPLVLLAGGRDKDLPWDSFAQVVSQRADHVVLFGEAAAKIAAALEAVRGSGKPETVDICSGLDEAVAAAARLAREPDVVLLAPGGTSFDEFKDFAERGERFRKLVQAL